MNWGHWIACLGLFLAAGIAAPPALAQDRYSYCMQMAQQQSGWSGPSSSSYQQGGAFRGAARGAARGALIGSISGNAGRGAAIGATTGGVFSAARSAAARNESDRRQHQYQQILDSCMRG